MKRIFFLFSLCLVSFVYSQKMINADHIVVYTVDHQQLGYDVKEDIVVFINTERGESFSESTNNYVLDSLIANGRISADSMETLSYGSNFNEKTHRVGNKYNVYEKIINVSLRYEEEPNINWKITNETQLYQGVELTKAETEAFGRKWIAWFSKDPLPYGPYKFGNLPGLIYLLEDENKDFKFYITQFKKKNKKVVLPQIKDFVPVKKNQVEQIRYGQMVNRMSEVVIYDDPVEKKERRNRLEKRFKDHIRLDIEYPYQP